MGEIPHQYIKNLYKALLAFIIIVSLFFVVKVLSEYESYRMMDRSYTNTITLSGHGEVSAVPDVASIYFTITKEAKTSKQALDGVAEIEKKALDFLRSKSIADKDIKTENASSYPKYEYRYEDSLDNLAPPSVYPRPGKNVLVGYEASESITVKIRNADDAGAIVQGLGGVGASNLSGPNFTIDKDKEDVLKAEARKKAIDDAKEKAKILAKDLGVRLGKVVSFNEGGNYGDMYYAKAEMMQAGVSSSPAPSELLKC